MPDPKLPSPVSLSDTQLDSVMRAAAPLEPRDCGPFLEEVARELARLPEVGDGALHRLVMMVQRKHFYPPDSSIIKQQPRHTRKARS
jgi:hypothetical protein